MKINGALTPAVAETMLLNNAMSRPYLTAQHLDHAAFDRALGARYVGASGVPKGPLFLNIPWLRGHPIVLGGPKQGPSKRTTP